MSARYLIVIKNMSSQTMSFYAFQKQAAFTASGSQINVHTSCLASGPLASNANSGAQLDFSFDAQNYAAAKSNIAPSDAFVANVLISTSPTMEAVSEASAVQAIDLAPGSGQADDYTSLTISPLGLSKPVYQSGIPAGAFAIQVPSFDPGALPELVCGCATINQDGSITLSSYVAPPPNSQICCAPLPYYYVKTGSYPVGQPITYDPSQAAACDFGSGYPTKTVQYNADGSFDVTDGL